MIVPSMISGHSHDGHREHHSPRVASSGHRISARAAPIPVLVAHTSDGDISPDDLTNRARRS
jgi:hypothetical protein